jgi:hypothetical protein
VIFLNLLLLKKIKKQTKEKKKTKMTDERPTDERPAKKMRIDNEDANSGDADSGDANSGDANSGDAVSPYYHQFTIKHGPHITPVICSFETKKQFEETPLDDMWIRLMFACNRKNNFADEKGEHDTGMYSNRTITEDKELKSLPDKTEVDIKYFFNQDDWQVSILRIKRNGQWTDKDESDLAYNDEKPKRDLGSETGESDTEVDEEDDDDDDNDDEDKNETKDPWSKDPWSIWIIYKN